MVTLDYIRDIQIYQHKKGYRFSVDALLLAAFVDMPRVSRIADFCTGSGVIGLLLARKFPSANVTLVELQKSLARLAQRNSELNGMADRVTVVHADLKDLATADGRRRGSAGVAQTKAPVAGKQQDHPEVIIVPARLPDIFTSETCDLVVANPPFRVLRTGKMSIADEKAIARHELALPLKDLVASAAFLMRHHGRFCFIHLPERLADLIVSLRGKGLEVKRIRFVHSRVDTEAKMVLVEAVKNAKPGIVIEPPLCLYTEDGSYTDEVLGFYQVEGKDQQN